MNFKKLLLIIVPIALLIVGYQYFTRIDRTNPVAVGTAFTKAVKARDTSAASKYWVPDKAQAWKTDVDARLSKLRTNATESYFEHVPSDPAFTAAPTAVTVAGTMTLISADKSFNLDLAQSEGKWYVSKAPL